MMPSRCSLLLPTFTRHIKTRLQEGSSTSCFKGRVSVFWNWTSKNVLIWATHPGNRTPKALHFTANAMKTQLVLLCFLTDITKAVLYKWTWNTRKRQRDWEMEPNPALPSSWAKNADTLAECLVRSLNLKLGQKISFIQNQNPFILIIWTQPQLTLLLFQLQEAVWLGGWEGFCPQGCMGKHANWGPGDLVHHGPHYLIPLDKLLASPASIFISVKWPCCIRVCPLIQLEDSRISHFLWGVLPIRKECLPNGTSICEIEPCLINQREQTVLSTLQALVSMSKEVKHILVCTCVDSLEAALVLRQLGYLNSLQTSR